MSTFEGSALSAFFNSLLTKLRSSEVLEFATGNQACQKGMKKWEEILLEIHPLLEDAEAKQSKNEIVRAWLADVQYLAYDMDDILDVFVAESLKRKVMQKQLVGTSTVHKLISTCLTSFTPAALKFDNEMMSTINEIAFRLEDFAVQKSLLRPEEIPSLGSKRIRNKMRETYPHAGSTHLFGLEVDKNAILELVLNNTFHDGGVDVIPIVGMAGIGKTTLAQLVFNDEKVKNCFEFRLWVCVSDDFDVTRITKEILEKFSYGVYGGIDLGMLQMKLKEKLSNKKFLLVLDDVWNESYTDWKILRSPFEVGAPGSKILVTTRSERVSQIMGTITAHRLQPMSEQGCLSILTSCALRAGDFRENQELKEIGMEIAKRCYGLPLVAKIIGGILVRNLNKESWQHILEIMRRRLLDDTGHLLPTLRLSYDHFPSPLRLCFAYCSIFSKEYEFKEDDIVLLWMAEGFLPKAANEMEMENLGREYFKELVAVSFFQRSSLDESRFVMPELIHDLAQSVAGRTCFRMEHHRQMEISNHVRHLSYDSSSSGTLKNFKPSKNLRTFIPLIQAAAPQNTYRCIPNNVLLHLLPKLKFLRVLSLREFSMSKLPDSIGGLRLLRYLDLSHSKLKSLPDSICALYNLQTLLLKQCRNLEKLPSKIGNLVNLLHLDITGTFSLTEMPIQIGELTNLQTLSNFVLAPSGCHIRVLKNFSHLKGELSISGLENIVTTEDAMEAGLGDKSGLRRLKLKWREHMDRNLGKGVETEVLDMLQPPKGLEELIIEGYDGTLFPNWVGDPSFSSLLFLELKNCKKCTSLPPIGNLPLLRDLCIKGMSSLRSIGVEIFTENVSNVSSPLETLLFEDMAEWEDWNFEEQTGRLPCLRELSIIRCPKLAGRLPSQLPLLEKLLIRKCNQLVASISRLPMLHQLEIDGCKNLIHGSSVELSSLKKVSLYNISAERLMLGLTKVESVQIHGCEELTFLWRKKWAAIAHMGSLKELMISNCPKLVPLCADEDEEERQQLGMPCSINYLNLSSTICKLPNVSCIFTCLWELRIEKCPELVSFSEGSFPLSLKRLVIRYCVKLQYFLEKGKYMNFRNISRLEDLNIEQCPALIALSSRCELPVKLQKLQIVYCPKLASLSSSAKLPAELKKLHISNCPELKSISGELPVRLESLQIWHCLNLTDLSPSGKVPEGLKYLQIGNCPQLKSVAHTIFDNSALEYIGVIGCSSIRSLPQDLDKLKFLEEIVLIYCPRLSFSSGWLPRTKLKVLHIDACEKFQGLPNKFHEFTSLKELEMSDCPFPDKGFRFPPNLISLSISQPKAPMSLNAWGLSKLTCLEQLSIEGGCPGVVSFPPEECELMLPSSLVQLTIKDFPSLKSLSRRGFKELTSLKYLSVKKCPKVRSLPTKDALPSLYRLHIDECPLLGPLCKINGLEWPKIAHIPYVRIEDVLISAAD